MNEDRKMTLPGGVEIRGIRYLGDFGTEPEDVREEKAQEYAARVIANAERNAFAKYHAEERARRGWSNLWGWL